MSYRMAGVAGAGYSGYKESTGYDISRNLVL